jgi:hypothetical protein
MKFSRRAQRFILPVVLFGAYSLGSRFLQTTDVDRLGMLSNAALTSIGRMRRPHGIGIWAFDSYIRACAKARINPNRISQTIGYAKASAGFHAPDGNARERGQLIQYTCALDISVRGLSRTQIYALVSALSDAGFVAWYRTGPKWVGNNHIHCVFLGYPMKPQLRAQVKDAFAGKDALVGHRIEKFYKLTATQKRQLTALYNHCSLGKSAPKAATSGAD